MPTYRRVLHHYCTRVLLAHPPSTQACSTRRARNQTPKTPIQPWGVSCQCCPQHSNMEGQDICSREKPARDQADTSCPRVDRKTQVCNGSSHRTSQQLRPHKTTGGCQHPTQVVQVLKNSSPLARPPGRQAATSCQDARPRSHMCVCLLSTVCARLCIAPAIWCILRMLQAATRPGTPLAPCPASHVAGKAQPLPRMPHHHV